MPAPPAAAVTVQAVGELVKRCMQGEVSRLQKALGKALEDNASLRRTVGGLEWELAKVCEESDSFQHTLHKMVGRGNSSGNGGYQYKERRLCTQSKDQFSLLCFSPSPSPPGDTGLQLLLKACGGAIFTSLAITAYLNTGCANTINP